MLAFLSIQPEVAFFYKKSNESGYTIGCLSDDTWIEVGIVMAFCLSLRG